MSRSLRFGKKPLYLAMQIICFSSSALFSIAHADTESDSSTLKEENNQSLPTITLTAEKQSAVTENTGSYTTGSTNTATKLNLSLRETPQTVKVYTRQYLDDKNIESFQELLTNITGVSVSRTDERLGATARGFAVDYYLVDGLPSTLTLGDGDPDLGIYDRVEVVKGANGLMTGAGNPSMGLNFIRKHANAKEFTGDVTASGGSWNSFASTADLSAPLNNDGSLRGRVFVKNSQEDSFMDGYERERKIAYGAIDYDLSEKTSISLAAMYQELERDGVRWGGLPAFYTDGSRTNFDRSLIVSSDWTSWDTNSTAFFANLKQNLFNDVNLNVAYAFRRDDVDSNILYTAGKVDKATNSSDASNVSIYKSTDITDENNIDVYISAPFKIADRQQEIVFGGSWNKNEVKKNKFGQTFVSGNAAQSRQNVINLIGVDALSYDNMNTSLISNLEMNSVNDLDKTEQSSAYISGKFHILDPLKAVAGLRLSNWKYTAHDTNGDGTVAASRNFKNELTPYAGIIYDFAEDYSWYASYTSIFKPQSRKQEDGTFLDPIDGKSYETGIKGEFFNNKLNAALSIFRIEQDNVAQLLLDEQGGNVKVKNSAGNPTAENAYYGTAGVKSEGIEFNADGEINENWGLSFGIANFSAKDAKGNDVVTTSSRTTSDLFLKYKNQDWSAGAGLNYLSKIYTGTGANRIDRGDLYLASAMVGYNFDKNMSAQLNVNNIFDKKYYEGIGANSMNWASPRNATLTLRYKF